MTGTVKMLTPGGSVCVYSGTIRLVDGGVWLQYAAANFSGANIAEVLHTEPRGGKWLFLPLHRVTCISTDDRPAD